MPWFALARTPGYAAAMRAASATLVTLIPTAFGGPVRDVARL